MYRQVSNELSQHTLRKLFARESLRFSSLFSRPNFAIDVSRSREAFLREHAVVNRVRKTRESRKSTGSQKDETRALDISLRYNCFVRSQCKPLVIEVFFSLHSSLCSKSALTDCKVTPTAGTNKVSFPVATSLRGSINDGGVHSLIRIKKKTTLTLSLRSYLKS